MIENPFPADDEESEYEWQLQVACADWIRGHIYKGIKLVGHTPIPFHYLKFHHPAMEYRGEAEGGKYKRRGAIAGIPDWLIWGPKRWHGMIELKVAGRGLNANQKEVHRWATEYEFPWAICRSVKSFRDTIISWGFECKNMACKEPDYRSDTQKKHDAFEWGRPL